MNIQHLACIMDGNRRWARDKGLLSWEGHKEGITAARRVVSFCLEKGIPYLSLYTFSIENFNRTAQELAYLFSLMTNEGESLAKEFVENDVRVCFIGNRALFPKQVQPIINRLEQSTAHCTALQLNLLFCYGARQEIVGSIKRIVQKIKEGLLSEDDISDQLVENHLWTSGIPAPDIIVRTGGVRRLSNFLLYQAAYSEFYFLDCFWPDITREHLEHALGFFYECQRNFGT